MAKLYDEICRILATPMPRSRALKLIFGGLAGAVLAPFGFGQQGNCPGNSVFCPGSVNPGGLGECCPPNQKCCPVTGGNIQTTMPHCCPGPQSCCGDGCCTPSHHCEKGACVANPTSRNP